MLQIDDTIISLDLLDEKFSFVIWLLAKEFVVLKVMTGRRLRRKR